MAKGVVQHAISLRLPFKEKSNEHRHQNPWIRLCELQETPGEAEKAVAQLSVPATLTKVEDIKEIMAYKILATPALVINGEVKSAG